MASVLAPLSPITPLVTLLPDGPSKEPFTPKQWETLLAILDTIIQSIQKDATKEQEGSLSITEEEFNAATNDLRKLMATAPDDDSFEEYLNEKGSDVPEFKELVRRIFGQHAPEKSRKGVAFILSALNTRVGSLMLTGYSTPLHEQPIRIREDIINAWRVSYISPLNIMYKQMLTLAKNSWLRTSPTFRKLSGVPSVPDHYEPGPGHAYNFITFEANSKPAVIETDVVIVGSGCGGAVCAKNLAEAGHRILVVEKGVYFSPNQFPMTESVGATHLFEAGATVASDDGSIGIVAGNTWGGGGTINWSASLQPQDFVRKEWAQEKGLGFFETAEFQSCLDRVCDRMGVSTTQIRHNIGNQVLLEGSRKLGYSAKAVPQNTGGKEHYCGHCTFGCGTNQKQGPIASWLPDAAKAGAKFVERFQVERVLFDEEDDSRATGVRGVWTSRNKNGGVDGPISEKVVRNVIVKAKKVIISCGSLWSPVVLLKSGLTNWQIGRNLHLHPVNMMAGVFAKDVRPWEGGILTSVCNSFENLDGQGHGAKLECTVMLPSLFLVGMNWTSGLSFKTNALKLRNMTGYISIVRDRDSGRVYADLESGRPRVQYTPSGFDRAHCMEGLFALAKILYIEGALEIHPFIQGAAPFIRSPIPTTTTSTSSPDPGITDPAFTAWLEQLKATGNKPPSGIYTSAHQMGSCRMSATENEGVVNFKGKVWGKENLYIADASVFPSASGVNPMVTNMAICDWISRGIVKDMKEESER